MTAVPWHATVVTLFPEAFPGTLGLSNPGRALAENRWRLDMVALRDHGLGKHRTVDDTPSGGGPGMVLRADVVDAALEAADAGDRPLLAMAARGRPLTQARVREWVAGPGLVLLCGRFEGIDQRVLDARGVEEVALGDIVLAGGEVAAMALLEACVRLLPGVMGADASGTEESFEGGLLEYPHYTRPAVWNGHAIPDVLLSGDHAAIRDWRHKSAEALTKTRRPDLWAAHVEAQGPKGPDNKT